MNSKSNPTVYNTILYWKIYMYYVYIIHAVCDLPPNRQEQMPMEESGNMVQCI